MANSTQRPKVIPGIPVGALSAIDDINTREVLRAVVDGLHVRNGMVGNGDERFITARELNALLKAKGTQVVDTSPTPAPTPAPTSPPSQAPNPYVPVTHTAAGSTPGAGIGNWIDVASMQVPLIAPGRLFAFSSGQIAYSAGWASAASRLLIDGVVVNTASGSEAYINALHAGSLPISTARTVVVQLQFAGASAAVSIINPTLFATLTGGGASAGALVKVLGGLSLASSGITAALRVGNLSRALGRVTLASAARGQVKATAAKSLGALQLSAGNTRQATLGKLLGALGVTGSAAARATASAASTLGPLASRAAAYAPTLYVATNGSDSNNGLNSATPFRTIAKAASVAVAGDVISVADGQYDGGFATGASGTASQPIVYFSANKWGAKIVPPSSSATDAGWNNTGAYVVIDGFEIDGTNDPASGTKWRFGINSTGEGTIVKNTHVHHIALTVAVTSSGGAGILLDSYYNGQNMQALNNLVHHVGPVGGGNWFHGIYMTASGKIQNNIVGNVVGGGIHLWHDARHIEVTNNTCFNNKIGIIYGGGDFVNLPPPCDYIIVTNNIMCNNAVNGLSEQQADVDYVGPNCIIRNNLVDNSGTAYSTVITTPTDTYTGDPLFANYQANASGDYHITPGSPAIGHGIGTYSPTADYAGSARGGNGRYDIGAYVGP
jgi:hypothetical protein